jgi:hypothetical protein
MKIVLLVAAVLLPRLILAQEATQVPVTFTGGHETDGPDRGRPVVLIAAALKVPPEVFREAFTHVKPAGPGQQPQEEQVRKNKHELMQRLAPYGVTDDRLNEVSNQYRYRRESGELWKHVEATAYATVSNGTVTGITITNPGSGYSSPPEVSIAGMPQVTATAVLSFGTDFATNGSVKEIRLGKIAAPGASGTPAAN